MSNIAYSKSSLYQASLFKLVILVTGIVVGMFVLTALVGLVFMPNQLIVATATDDVSFLFPLVFSTICSAIILGLYVRAYASKSKK